MALELFERLKISWTMLVASKDVLSEYRRAPQISELNELRRDLTNAEGERLTLQRELAAALAEAAVLKSQAEQFAPGNVRHERSAYWLRSHEEDDVSGPFCTRCFDLKVGRVLLKKSGMNGQCPECKVRHHGVWPEDQPPPRLMHTDKGWLK